jgi:hypothetical protein
MLQFLRPTRLVAYSLLILTLTGTAEAGSLFSDDFESGSLSKWDSNAHGQIVVDPLNSSNHSLDFTARDAGGDIFSPLINVTPGVTYVFSFDYLGTAPDAAGFAGLYGSFGENWVAGASPYYSGTVLMPDDGTWHHYSFAFTITGGDMGVKFEDWNGNGGTSLGDAYFDNVILSTASAVPEPSGLVLAILGILGILVSLGHQRFRRAH